MGRFDHLASKPRRGPADILRWKVLDRLRGVGSPRERGEPTPTRAPDHQLVASRAPSLTWIGHATFLLTLGGTRILIDPIFRERLGPVRRLAPPGIALEDLPPIDLVLITHNHRDHLDAWSIARLGSGPRYVAPLGHHDVLRRAGATDVVELDWWGSLAYGALTVTLVPARHWSMRVPWDANDALWGGYVIRGPEGAAYHSGDTAFFEGFAEIGRRAGPIDWAMLPIGAYEPRWFMSSQHMNPEEAAEAAALLRARTSIAMHWGTFELTDEPSSEPPVRARTAWSQRGDAGELWVLDIGESRRLH